MKKLLVIFLSLALIYLSSFVVNAETEFSGQTLTIYKELGALRDVKKIIWTCNYVEPVNPNNTEDCTKNKIELSEALRW